MDHTLPSAAARDGQWHHLEIAVGTDGARVYLDGVRQD